MGTLKITTTVRFEAPEFDDVMDSTTADQLGQTVKDAIIKSCLAGLSPVKGFGRFEGYKNASSGGYPRNVMKDFPGKTVRPVNLWLTGDMLESLTWERKGDTVSVFIPENTHASLKAETHNEGTQSHVPVRKFLPTAEGEEFTESIQRLIFEIMRQRVETILKK